MMIANNKEFSISAYAEARPGEIGADPFGIDAEGATAPETLRQKDRSVQ